MGSKLLQIELILWGCLAGTISLASTWGEDWHPAHATFYGGEDGNDGTMGKVHLTQYSLHYSLMKAV